MRFDVIVATTAVLSTGALAQNSTAVNSTSTSTTNNASLLNKTGEAIKDAANAVADGIKNLLGGYQALEVATAATVVTLALY